MRIIPWVALAPSISSTPIRSAVCVAMSTSPAIMNLPSWVVLLKQGIAKHKNDPTAKYCQLATAAMGGGASCRTWVFRGFWEDTCVLKFITDIRSQKIAEIAADNRGEVCFYLSKTREQFRISGRLQVITASETDEQMAKARRSQWGQISPAAQASFMTSMIPGSELSEEQIAEAEARRGRQDASSPAQEPLREPTDEFCLVLLWPQSVDHLELRDGQRRRVHTAMIIPPKKDDANSDGVAREDAQRGSANIGDGMSTWRTNEVVP